MGIIGFPVTTPLPDNAQEVIAKTTFSDLQTNYPAASYDIGDMALVTDVGSSPGTWFHVSDEYIWRPTCPAIPMYHSTQQYINFGGTSATYTQSGNIITVTQTAHGMTTEQNGGLIYLTQSTGTFVSEWCSGFTYINANSFSCTSMVSRTTSGNLGTNTSETFIPWSFTMPVGLIKKYDILGISFLLRVKPSANLKTLKPYYSGFLTTAAAGLTQTTGTTWLGANPVVFNFNSDNTFVITGLTTTAVTDTNRTFTVSSTLANASDWQMIIVNGIPYQPRYNGN